MTDEHERDLRDPALDAAWRAQSGEARSPPPALDAAILAAAHRAVKSAPARIGPGSEATRPWRWWTPLMAAAAIGAVAIGVLQLAPHEPDATQAVSDVPSNAHAPAAAAEVRSTAPSSAASVTPSSTTDQAPAKAAPAPAASPAPAPTKVAPTPAPEPVPSSPSTPDAQTTQESRAAETRSARQVPDPFPAQREAASSADARGKVERSREVDAAAPADAAASKATAPQPRLQDGARSGAAAGIASTETAKRVTRDDATAARTPDEWIARIRSQLARADDAAAARELAAFRAAFADADARLPADLRPWAAGVPRAPR